MSDRDNPFNSDATPARVADIVPRKIAGDTILVPVRGRLAELQRIFVLDDVAEHIWSLLDGSRTIDSVVVSVTEHFDIEATAARSDLLDFLRELEEAGLIVTTGDPVDNE